MVGNTRKEGPYALRFFSEELGGTAAWVMRGVRNTSMFKHHISEKDDDDNEEVEHLKNHFYI